MFINGYYNKLDFSGFFFILGINFINMKFIYCFIQSMCRVQKMRLGYCEKEIVNLSMIWIYIGSTGEYYL